MNMTIEEILEELDKETPSIDHPREDYNWNTYDDNYDPKYQELLESIKDLKTTNSYSYEYVQKIIDEDDKKNLDKMLNTLISRCL